MKDLSLNDMLRYALAGGIAVVFACVSYDQPACWLTQKYEGTLVAIVAAALPFLLGAVAYVFNRAAPLLPFYRVLCTLHGRKDSLRDIDIIRWKNQGKKGAIQPRLSEWAAQIHFLYSSFWAAVLVECAARAAQFTPSPWRHIAYISVLSLLALAIFHHYRYLGHEKLVFEYDNSLPNDG